MSRILRRRPSPSMIVALIALCVALAGTATALPGRARVKKDDIARAAVRATHIKSSAVQSKHIRSRAVTRSKIARRAVGSSEVGQDALTGDNIVESSLGTVANASNATNATNASNASNAATVNGRTVQKFSFIGAIGTPATTVLSLNGLSLVVTCNAQLSVVARTSLNGAFIHAGGTQSSGGSYGSEDDDDDGGFNIGEPVDVIHPSGTDTEGTLTYVRADGEVVTATFLAEETASGCVFAGTATG